MLTKRQNLLETIRGGHPDRFVNQFEAFTMLMGDPYMANYMHFTPGSSTCLNAWGVTIQFKEGTPGPFPVHDDEHKVVHDVTKWRETVHAPNVHFPKEAWQKCLDRVNAVDRDETFVTFTVAPGVFEQLHYLMGMDDCLVNFYLEPEAMKELIDYITDWELEYAAELCENAHPDVILHHDDWGSQRSTFLSPEMFDEFLLPSVKKIYGYYKSHGVELIIHHSDSFAATLVPRMIEGGIDIWQGCLDTNDLPALIRQYGGQISFMGGINNGVVDMPDWTEEKIAAYVEKTCRACGTLYYIPSCTAGGPATSFPGAYDAVTRQIDRMSGLMFP